MDTDWDALPPSDRDGSAKGLPPAIILDVDETVLDNSMHQARLIRDERGFDSNRWAAWVREGRADAIPGAAEFILHASDRGVAVYFVTNRSVELVDATMTNLRRVGIPVAGAEFVLGRGTPVSGCDEGSEKHCRRRLVGRRHRVLLQIGDQLSDLVSVTGNTRQARQTSVEPFAAWMGERWFLLPNPIYGSWESALFDHDWTLDEPTRRRRKLDALND